MDIHKEIFLNDLYHLLSFLFKSNKVKKLYCVCSIQDFMLQSLLRLKSDKLKDMGTLQIANDIRHLKALTFKC
jgi:hypothetical protein